jgi:hypothetical protein
MTSVRQRLRASTVVFLVGIAGCSGTYPAVPVAPGPGAPLVAARRSVRVAFRFHIPRKHRTERSQHFISPATESIGITVDAGPQQTVLNADVTPGSPSCNGNVCTLALHLAPGSHVFDVRTYDEPLSGGVPQGAILSQNIGFPFKVVAGRVNDVGMVLQGVPAGITVTQSPGEDVSGDQQSGFNVFGGYQADGATIYPRVFTVAATDADGNLIVGAGAPALTLKSADTTTFSDGVAAPSNPNRFTVTPAPSLGYFNTEAVEFTAAAGSFSATFFVRIAAQIAPRVYITQQYPSKLWVFDELGNPIPSLQSKLDSINFGDPVGLGYCASTDELWVAGETSRIVQGVLSDGSAGYSYSPGFEPLGVACADSEPLVYVTTVNAPVLVFTAFSSPVRFNITGFWDEVSTATFPVTPWDILVDGSTVKVSDEATGVLEIYDTQGHSIGETSYLAVDPVGLVEVPGGPNPIATSRNANEVFDFGAFPLPGGFPGVSQPFGIRYDAVNGNVYVVNYGNSTVTRYDVSGDPVALPAGAFAGMSLPLEIAIVP